MSLDLKISEFCLGSGDDIQGSYLFLLDTRQGPSRYSFAAGARYIEHKSYLECKNLVSDGYGPTLFILLMQEAKRLNLKGVSPDSNKNSDEMICMVNRFYEGSPKEVSRQENPDADHTLDSLNQIYSISNDIVDESEARKRYQKHLGSGLMGKFLLWKVKRNNPLRARLWHTQSGLIDTLRRDCLARSDEPFK